MNRDAESQLLDLCVRQYASFSPEAWVAERLVAPIELAAAARFLAGCDWFGHRAGLLQVAEKLAPGQSHDFAGLAKAARFDCPRFAGRLKAHLQHALAHA